MTKPPPAPENIVTAQADTCYPLSGLGRMADIEEAYRQWVLEHEAPHWDPLPDVDLTPFLVQP